MNTRDRVAERRVARPVLAALALLILIVIALVAVGAFASYRVYTLGNQRFIKQAAPFFAVTEDLAVEMLNQETAVRGYVITGDPKTLHPYTQGKKYMNIELALIAKDRDFDPRIPRDLQKLRAEVNSLEAYFTSEIKLVKQGPAGKRRAQARVLAGKNHFDHLRSASGALIQDAADVVNRSHRDQHATLVTWWIFIGIAGFIALLTAIGLILRVPARLIALVREEHRARREAERTADAARALAHVREAVFLLSEDGAVQYLNPTAESWFGPGGELAKQELAELLREDAAGLRHVSLADGDRWLTVARTDFEDGTVLVFRDVSDDQRLERLRSDFVATAAHELRTPLAAVYGAVRTLRERRGLPAETNARFLELIEHESERLKTIVDQLLISAQLDSADLRLNQQPVDVIVLASALLNAAEARRPEGIQLSLESPNHDVFMQADPDRLGQVVANLIDNAMKYSPEGGHVAVRVRTVGGHGVIEVTDHGVGIPPDEQERIFEKFYRLDPQMTRGVGGSGLGLYISRQLVDQMGGRLSVSSRYGAGSTFSVTLPLAIGAAPAVPETRELSSTN